MYEYVVPLGIFWEYSSTSDLSIKCVCEHVQGNEQKHWSLVVRQNCYLSAVKTRN